MDIQANERMDIKTWFSWAEKLVTEKPEEDRARVLKSVIASAVVSLHTSSPAGGSIYSGHSELLNLQDPVPMAVADNDSRPALETTVLFALERLARLEPEKAFEIAGALPFDGIRPGFEARLALLQLALLQHPHLTPPEGFLGRDWAATEAVAASTEVNDSPAAKEAQRSVAALMRAFHTPRMALQAA